MLSFESDYTEGAHPAILEKFIETNMDQQSGYGVDVYSESARKKIAKACGKEDADIYFITGGTQTNQLVIDTMLKPYEGVVAAVTGHVAAHEAGAIEYTGHKVLTVPQYLGKLKASDVKELVDTFYNDANHEHMVFPGMVYISHPTEYGTLYTKEELKEISDVCHAYNLPLFLDGARLGYGLMSYDTDVTLEDIAELTDVFYIDSPTNQQFFIIDNKKLEELEKHVRYGFWEKYDDTHTVVRFATSWATTEESIEKLKELL
ncbi:threonine aldolase family protein [Catenibacterium sp.]|uniref:threonine aldolase family protein n=1 Tax=Catenibacterium sp. TaxID=2049022 RepID=UPI003AB28CC1